MLKKTLSLLAVSLLFVTLCLTLNPQNVASKTQDIRILSYSYSIDNLGILDVSGEIQNTGTDTIYEVILAGTAYGADGTEQGKSTCRAWVFYLAPQQKAPFMLEFNKPSNAADWYTAGVSKIDVSVSKADTTNSHSYLDLAISVSSAGVSTSGDDKGTYWVSGTVKNTGTQTASNLVVTAIYYNSSGSVVAVGYTDYLTPKSVASSGTVSFMVGAFYTDQTAEPSNRKITSYTLNVQADAPIIEGTAPASTAQTTGSTLDDASNEPSSQNTLYILIIAGVAIAVIAALLVSRRGHTTVKPAIETRKPEMKKKRAF